MLNYEKRVHGGWYLFMLNYDKRVHGGWYFFMLNYDKRVHGGWYFFMLPSMFFILMFNWLTISNYSSTDVVGLCIFLGSYVILTGRINMCAN